MTVNMRIFLSLNILEKAKNVFYEYIFQFFFIIVIIDLPQIDGDMCTFLLSIWQFPFFVA